MQRKELLPPIVPCCNEQEALPLFYKETAAVLDGLDVDAEILFVDDGSKDATMQEVRRLAERDGRVRYLSFSRNFGKEAAMYAGFCNAKGDYVAVMDADLQDPPSLLPQMIEALRSGEYDSVATRRFSRDGEPPVRSWFAKRFYSLANKLTDADMADGARDFRLMTRGMVDAIVAMSERNRFSKGIFGWVGFRTKWLPYENVERVAGESKWKFKSLFAYALDGIMNFSAAPLMVSSYLGGIMTLVSLAVIVFIVARKVLFGDPVGGWTSTVCIVIFMGGLQLLCIGIMGQYVARTFTESKGRPHYIVAQTNIEDAKRVL